VGCSHQLLAAPPRIRGVLRRHAATSVTCKHHLARDCSSARIADSISQRTRCCCLPGIGDHFRGNARAIHPPEDLDSRVTKFQQQFYVYRVRSAAIPCTARCFGTTRTSANCR